MEGIRNWVKAHPNLWEFILFNLLSNCATIINFIVMWLCTGFIFTAFNTRPFQFFIFRYTNVDRDLGLCGFLSFLVATAVAQTVNFFVQKNLVFKSNAAFGNAVPKYMVLAIALVVMSAALPAYSQTALMALGVPAALAPTLANVVNIVLQVTVSFPAMKFWIMPEG